ncbi:MAG: hypothetical protein K6T90_14860 [Leptolyngbyaceae cyanobacterium HOT.MB2.61]|nr:hypothetical protein [Leptolyngbyaceae cyanobacterium HOT.MB2.61]
MPGLATEANIIEVLSRH